MTPEEIYVGLGRLIENRPDMGGYPRSTEAKIWLGKARALVEEVGNAVDIVEITKWVNQYNSTNQALPYIMDVLYKTLAVAEMRAPAAAQGAFINAAKPFDAVMAVGKVLTSAASKARIVDPYMDEKALSIFAVLANEGVEIQLLSDSATVKASLQPAVQAFQQQYGSARPLEARLAPPRSLHDRLIVVDGTTVWTLTQSLNAFAARSPATIVRIEGDAVPLKIGAYDSFWGAATPV